MAKTKTIEVDNKTISIIEYNEQDYISLTDMVRSEDGNDHIRNWMRNRNTVEYLGLWETLHNPNFKGVEFDTFKKQAGLNSFNLTPKKWIEKTDAIGIISKSGRYGGTYAHKDLAFEFGAWLSSMFKLLIIKEYQRLKEIETNKYNLEWNVKRILSKANYHIHTDAIKNHIIPHSDKIKETEWLVYAEEADILNVALFGCTAKQWRDANPEHAEKKLNIRDFASINELAVLSNLESMNAEMINNKIDSTERFNKLRQIAQYQSKILNETDFMKALKRQSETTYINEQKRIDK